MRRNNRVTSHKSPAYSAGRQVARRKMQLMAVILLLGCATLALTGCAKREITNINSNGKNIICFGDSITMGYGVESQDSYPAWLGKMVTLPVLNAGIDGDTSSGGLKRINSDVLDREPLLVIIEFGANDFLTKVPMEETIKNVEKMVISIQAAGAMVAITDVSTQFVMNDYGKEYKALSDKYRAIFIPRILKGIFTNPSLKSDFIHPNARGYKIISSRIYHAIRTYLYENATLRDKLKGAEKS